MKIITHNASLAKSAAALLLIASIALAPGCFLVAVGAAGAAGAGTVAYVKGELDSSLGRDYEAVGAAASKAIGQLQFALISQAKDALTDTLTARTAQDQKVVIVVNKKSDQLTTIAIRVGVFGDEAVSRAVLDQINRNL